MRADAADAEGDEMEALIMRGDDDEHDELDAKPCVRARVQLAPISSARDFARRAHSPTDELPSEHEDLAELVTAAHADTDAEESKHHTPTHDVPREQSPALVRTSDVVPPAFA